MTWGRIATHLFKSPRSRPSTCVPCRPPTGSCPAISPASLLSRPRPWSCLFHGRCAIVIGGTHSITHALLRAFQKFGGEFYVLSEVDKIIVENGAAKGIRLTNGHRSRQTSL